MGSPTLTDLHLHSTASDGVLTPAALMHYASQEGLQHVALTDHDTLDGGAEAATAAAQCGLRFTLGVELSCQWQGRSLHVLGLGLPVGDPSDPSRLQPHLHHLRALRIERFEEIAHRLVRKGRIPATEWLDDLRRQHPLPTRLHLARALQAAGHVDSVQAAFDRWLGSGRPAHVPDQWPELQITLEVLRAAGALPVLAHAHRYRVSNGALARLVGEFAECGGLGLEVSVGGMARGDLDRLATLARRHRLAASAGSDFHDPALPWHRPGRFAKLPDDLQPIAARLP
jgi:predicted metal-dependent phosphoesterase TrpH